MSRYFLALPLTLSKKSIFATPLSLLVSGYLLCGCSPLQPLFSMPKIARGNHAGVATAHPLATKTAAYVLASGGNAIDAAVAASFVLAVVRPQ